VRYSVTDWLIVCVSVSVMMPLMFRAVVWVLKRFWHCWMPRPLLQHVLYHSMETRPCECHWNSVLSKYVISRSSLLPSLTGLVVLSTTDEPLIHVCFDVIIERHEGHLAYKNN